MDTTNSDSGKDDSVKDLGAEATCAPGCDCSAGGLGGRLRWITGIVILIVAGGLVARAMIQDNVTKTQKDEATFAAVAPTTDALPEPDAPESAAGIVKQVALVPGKTEAGKKVVAMIAGKEIATLADLNKLAADTDAVFVYLPGKETDSAKEAPTSQLESAVRTLKSRGIDMAIFTLKTDAPEYAELAARIELPAVVAVAKGRGMVPMTGEITEAKLVQGFVAASSSGGCGPASAGCGPSGCK